MNIYRELTISSAMMQIDGIGTMTSLLALITTSRTFTELK